MPSASVITLPPVPERSLGCMEIRGGNRAAHERLRLPGLEVWVHSQPFGGQEQGGDVHSLSSCGTGRISRLVLADVSGHGSEVASFARGLRRLMARFVNHLDQTRFVQELNQDLARSESGRFATSVAMTYFSPNRRLDLCNAGHPRPLLRRTATGAWSPLRAEKPTEGIANLPLGVLAPTRYEEFGLQLERGDLVLAYTDAVIESCGGDGAMLGEEGLLRIVAGLGAVSDERIVDAILEAIAAGDAARPLDDDLTIILVRCTAGREQKSFAARTLAGVRFVGILLRALVPIGERPPIPWPELSAPNILGPFWRKAALSWRGPRRSAAKAAP
ncbi:MAG TPA: PP2C family protein-serine/threonine phosphatase [Phycisphaerales bacterium]|nr:PP2C family protein-serine/threonine phosphatase [Phycisphaerales bacterium]HMP37514.1 PP2C family protein-serine/threonine phosphatase [Phycisphaerales bacterium]